MVRFLRHVSLILRLGFVSKSVIRLMISISVTGRLHVQLYSVFI